MTGLPNTRLLPIEVGGELDPFCCGDCGDDAGEVEFLTVDDGWPVFVEPNKPSNLCFMLSPNDTRFVFSFIESPVSQLFPEKEEVEDGGLGSSRYLSGVLDRLVPDKISSTRLSRSERITFGSGDKARL